jgi:hypothetical protein
MVSNSRVKVKKQVSKEVSEWSKEHAWKVCILQKGIVGSNPTFSAKTKCK